MLSDAIVEPHREHCGRLGIVRTAAELRRGGHRHSPKRVRHLARAAGLERVHPTARAKTTVPGDNCDGGLADVDDKLAHTDTARSEARQK
ncbi:MAG: IS3 family transposase [Stackebrandtia sp.]